MNALLEAVRSTTLNELAPKVHASPSTISRGLRGVTRLSPDVLRLLVHQLFTEEQAMQKAAKALREAEEALREYQKGRLSRERLDRYLADAEEAVRIARVFSKEDSP